MTREIQSAEKIKVSPKKLELCVGGNDGYNLCYEFTEDYMEQIELWQQKAEKFRAIPMIRANAERNMEMYRKLVEKMENIDFRC